RRHGRRLQRDYAADTHLQLRLQERDIRWPATPDETPVDRFLGRFTGRNRMIRTPLCNRNPWYLDDLIAVEPPVPLLQSAVDRLSVLKGVVAFGIVHVVAAFAFIALAS